MFLLLFDGTVNILPSLFACSYSRKYLNVLSKSGRCFNGKKLPILKTPLCFGLENPASPVLAPCAPKPKPILVTKHCFVACGYPVFYHLISSVKMYIVKMHRQQTSSALIEKYKHAPIGRKYAFSWFRLD